MEISLLKNNIQIIRGLNLSNQVPRALLVFIIDEIMKLLKNEKNMFNEQIYESYFKREKVQLNVQESKLLLGALSNLMRIAIKKEVSEKLLTQFLQENTIINEDYQNMIIEKYSKQLQLQSLSKTLSLGKLINMKWQVCSYLDDKKYENINKMYILLNFTTQGSDGKMTSDCVQLTLTEFKVFQQNLKEIQETFSQYSTEKVQEDTQQEQQ